MKVPPKKPHFFKPIQPGFKHGIKIPVGFLKYLKGQEQEHAVLRRAGKKWLVKVNGRSLGEGWEKFAEEHDLQLGNILVFRYDGNMEFEVVICDSSQCNREYAEHLQEEDKAHAFEETSKEFEIKDEPNSRIVSSRKAFHSKETSNHNSFGQSHVEFTIKSYCLSNGYFRLPKSFATANSLNKKNSGLTIRDGRQRWWNLRIHTSGSSVFVGGKWRKFCVANDLKIGDHIRFEVVCNGEKPIWKFHDLRGSPSLQPEVKKNKLDDKIISDKELHFQEQRDLKSKTLDIASPKSQVAVSTSADDTNPYFISTIKPYIITNPVLYLPMPFAKSNGLKNRTKMILVDEKRRSWSVRLGSMGSQIVIKRRGWTEFMEANDVRVGDTYKFELIKKGKIPVAYFHCKYSGKDDKHH